MSFVEWFKKYNNKVKNKTFFVFAIILILALPYALYRPAQTEEFAVITTLGIDKKGDQVEVSVLAVTPGNAASPENQNLELYTVLGDDVAQCMFRLNLSLGKEVGLAQCDSIVLSDVILKEGVQPYLDYFIRSTNLLGNAFLINCTTDSKELLKATTSMKNNYNLSLRHVIFHLDEYLFTTEATINHFYEKMFAENTAFLLPIVDVKNMDDATFGKEGETQHDSSSNSGSSSGGGESGTEGGSSGEGKSESIENQKVIRSEGKSALMLKGKKVKELTNEESLAMNLLSQHATKGTLVAYNVHNEKLKNAKVTMGVIQKRITYKAKFIDKKPVFKISLQFVCNLDSIVMEEYHVDDYEATTSYLDDELDKKLKENIYKVSSGLLNNGKDLNADYLESYRYFESYTHREWKEFLNSLENKDEYLKNIFYEIDVKIKTII